MTRALSETEVYLALKKYLDGKGWEILGGQPPGGTNSIPLIELKDHEYKGKGSKGSKKVDLIAFKRPYFLLIELKAFRSESDIAKLREITRSASWRRAFVEALAEKRRLPGALDREPYMDSDRFLVKALGFNQGEAPGPEDFVTFLVGDRISIHIGTGIPDQPRSLL